MWNFRRRTGDDFSTEIDAHIALEMDRLIAEGVNPDEARQRATRTFGNVTAAQERFYESGRVLWLDELRQDVRYGIRTLRRSRGFTATAVLTLALGIGANTAIFTVANAILLKPLPYPQSDRLIWIEEVRPDFGTRVPGTHFLDWQEHSRVTDGVAAYTSGAWTLGGVDQPERLDGYRVSASFFRTLGTRMALGRNFLPVEDREGGEPVVLLSHTLWQRQFRGDQDIVGRLITLDNEGHRVIGVLPRDFRFFAPGEVWLPLALNEAQEHGIAERNFGFSTLSVVARLRPGIGLDQATADLARITRTFARQDTAVFKTFAGARLRVTTLHQQLIGDTRRLLFVLLGAVVLTLIVACANIANLLLARSIVRQKELAVRAALGASRMRLLRQIFTESLVLALTGGMMGVILASLLVRALVIWNFADLFGPVAQLATFSQDTRVLVFTLLASLLCAACFGLLAAVKPGRTPLSGMLTQSGHHGRLQRHTARQALVIGEVAVAVVLLVGTGLFVRSFVNLVNVDPGYRSENLLTSRVSLPVLRYQDRARRVQVQHELLERIAQVPGIEKVGGISALPLTEGGLAAWLSSSGPVSVGPGATTPSIPVAQVSSDYFPAMGIALRAGRLFDERDNAEAAPVIILSESVARQLFPDQDPIGRTVWLSAFVRGRGVTVTGVVADVRHEGLDRDVRPQVYIPYQQFPPVGFVLAVRTAGAPQNVTADVRAAVRAVDPELPLYDVVTMEQRLAESVAPRRFMLLLIGSLGLLALVLALVGIFGVVSYLVTQRTREIGIRMALGARHCEVLTLVLRQGLAAVAGGLVIGIAGATAVTRFLSSMLFQLSPLDPVTFAAVASAFAGIATCAALIPARRAARVNPLVALRYE